MLHPGWRNGGAGPDFLGAALEFPDGSVRRGDVEIHRRRDGWGRHRHQWSPLYNRVILHVVASGPLDPVVLAGGGRVPTVLLPMEMPLELPCEVTFQPLADEPRQAEFLRLLGAQRWWRRLVDWRHRPSAEVLAALSVRLGDPRRREELLGLWQQVPSVRGGLPSFVERIVAALPLDRRGGHCGRISGRVALLSGLAFALQHRPEELALWSLKEVRLLAQELGSAGFPIPSRHFLTEVVGNWLLPLGEVRSGADRFEEWYGLPLGWSYGRIRRQVARLGLAKPASFGEQQALLEWIESLCQPVACAGCPVVGAADGP